MVGEGSVTAGQVSSSFSSYGSLANQCRSSVDTDIAQLKAAGKKPDNSNFYRIFVLRYPRDLYLQNWLT